MVISWRAMRFIYRESSKEEVGDELVVWGRSEVIVRYFFLGEEKVKSLSKKKKIFWWGNIECIWKGVMKSDEVEEMGRRF